MSAFTSDGTENRMRWDRRSRGFMEVWYATLNHAPTGAGIWLRYTLTAPTASDADPYCELWGFYFDPRTKRHFAAKERFGIDRLGAANGRDDGALVRLGDAWLSETHLEGEVANRDGRLAWSLDLEPAPRCYQHLPAQLRGRIEKRISTVCSPNLSVPFTGTIKVGEDVLELEREIGCQSHRWGARHSQTWSWAHCGRFQQDADAVFEGVAAQAALGPVPGPTMTFLYVSYGGNDLVFNDLRWAMRARSRYELPTWAFTARNESWKMAGAARANIENMVQVAYTDPDGSPRYCANSEVADLGIEIYRRDGSAWRHAGSLTSLGGAHVEFGRPEPFAELPVAF